MPQLDVTGKAAATSSLSGMVTRGALPWEGGPPPRLHALSGPVKCPTNQWKAENAARMRKTGEAYIQVILRVILWLQSLRSSKWRVLRSVGGAFSGIMIATAELRAHVTHGDGSVTDYGVVSRHLVTTAGKNFLAACFPNTNEPEVMKYHGFGTGTTAAVVGDTALQTEFSTEYVVNSTRPTGSQSSSLNTYITAATFSPDSGGTLAVTEHGIFSATSAGTLFDRNVFRLGSSQLVSGTAGIVPSSFTLVTE